MAGRTLRKEDQAVSPHQGTPLDFRARRGDTKLDRNVRQCPLRHRNDGADPPHLLSKIR